MEEVTAPRAEEQLEEDARKATEEKLELARGLCDVTGSADEADKELVAQELAKMPREDLERMKANGTRVAVCRGSVRSGFGGCDCAGIPPKYFSTHVHACAGSKSPVITRAALFGA